MFGRNYTTYNRDYFDSNLDTVLQHFINNPDETNIRCIYKECDEIHNNNNELDMDNIEFGEELFKEIQNSKNPLYTM